MKHPLMRAAKSILALTMAAALCAAPAAQALSAEQLQELLQEYYIEDVKPEVANQSTVEDILKALDDPYTVYLTSQEYQELLSSMEDDEIVGIGISAIESPKGLQIVGVFADSPAKKAGLKAGDIITAVDGQRTQGQTAEVITSWIKGEEGTEVSMEVLHADGTTSNAAATRKTVIIPATRVELVDGDVGYFVCDTFGKDTLAHFLEGTENQQAKTWVVDLRKNPGGDVNAVTQSLGVFLGEQTMVYLRDGKDQYLRFVSNQSTNTLYPTIVLTSPWTASAAEIFSGVMRDKSEGLVIGSRTYGKGVAQIFLDGTHFPEYFTGGDAIKMTAYRYFTAGGSTADRVGIIPHLVVDPDQADEVALLFCETDPGADNEGYLRLHVGGWRWVLNAKEAVSKENRADFVTLLEALPPQYEVYQGMGNGKWITATAETIARTYDLQEYTPRTFADAEKSPFALEINTLRTYELLKGYQDGTFRPQDNITRGELCCLLAQALHLNTSKNDSEFTDVSAQAAYAESINAVCAAGLMQGVGGNQFLPLEPVNHEQLITVMARMGAFLNAELYELSKNGLPQKHAVPASYSDWAKSWVWLMSESQQGLLGNPLNLLYDEVSNIAPKEHATRGEVAAQLYQVLAYIHVLPV